MNRLRERVHELHDTRCQFIKVPSMKKMKMKMLPRWRTILASTRTTKMMMRFLNILPSRLTNPRQKWRVTRRKSLTIQKMKKYHEPNRLYELAIWPEVNPLEYWLCLLHPVQSQFPFWNPSTTLALYAAVHVDQCLRQ